MLQSCAYCGIIIYVMCAVCVQTAKRYALKRKVAGGVPGNFRGVCPILNRAIGIVNTVCGNFFSAACVCADYAIFVLICS